MALLPGGSRDVTPGTPSRTGSKISMLPLTESSSSEESSGSNGLPHSRGPISPPPLGRRVTSVTSIKARTPPPPPLDGAEIIDAAAGNEDRETPSTSDSDPKAHSSVSVATPSPSSRTKNRSQPMAGTPAAQTAISSNSVVRDIASRLKDFGKEIREDHAQMVAYAIESTKATERRVSTGRDLFARFSCKAVPEIKGKTMRIKSKHLSGKKDQKEEKNKSKVSRMTPSWLNRLNRQIDAQVKQHPSGKKDQKEEHFDPICTKTNKDAVPSYRFHHVEIKKNVLAPHTMLTFVPHHRDLDSSDEAKYNSWLKELEEIDLKSGFKPMNRIEKRDLVVRSERAATMSLYLDTWLDKLDIPHCNKLALIRYLASLKQSDATTPQQHSDTIRLAGNGGSLASDSSRAARVFNLAFQLAFAEGQPASKAMDLREVLSIDLRQALSSDESADSVSDNKSAAKETGFSQHDDIDKVVESSLDTYCCFGCLICFSHSCDHGEFDIKNLKRTFSLTSPLAEILRRRRALCSTGIDAVKTPCTRRCYRLGVNSNQGIQRKEWTEEEHILLRSLYITSDHGRVKMDPICLAAEFLNRLCYDVYTELLYLGISRPLPVIIPQGKPGNVAWYDGKKKMLLGDWQDQTVTHEHQRREILEPCSHDGPCAPKICRCVDAGLLCEKFCSCTVDNCCYKFTGCACHSQGKTCYAKQKDRPCICVQLNRECDPQLCGPCGALDHADPVNADDLELHSTGCQNCELQRGVHKSLLLGQSQLDGVGYGLFAAEDIAQDEFVIEYVGELITHDEGVRREARRGDVFDEESHISYLFTLLENEGIWVDAAIYGNLSRYINHASEHDTWGCNITPRILYVNGEYRIKFTALRDITAGEELFFNYGEHFPNLTKKLLDNKAGTESEVMKPKVGRPRRAEAGDRVARKAPKPEQPRVKKSRTAKKTIVRARPPIPDEEGQAKVRTRKRKRGLQDDSTEDEYHPATAKHEASRAAKSEDDSEGAIRAVSKRPGRKAGPHSEAEEPDTPSRKAKDRLRTQGRRDEAGPRGGRPRKPSTWEPTPTGEASTSMPSTQVVTPIRNKAVDKERSVVVIEIEDSEDEDVPIRDRGSRNRRMPAKFRDDEVETY